MTKNIERDGIRVPNYPISFQHNSPLFYGAMSLLSNIDSTQEDEANLNSGNGKTFLLAGMDTSPLTINAYCRFCSRWNHSNDNEYRWWNLISGDCGSNIALSTNPQAHFIFNDYGILFSTDKYLSFFSRRMSQKLRKDGLLFATVATPPIPFLANARRLINGKTLVYYRSIDRIVQSMSDLKLVLHAEEDDGIHSVLVFAHPDGKYAHYPQYSAEFSAADSWYQMNGFPDKLSINSGGELLSN